MATYNDIDAEKVAAADKFAHRKANTVGDNGTFLEEPFANNIIVRQTEVFVSTPTASGDFDGTDYADSPSEGVIGTRYVQIRLHPLVSSGLSGNDSIQTFVAVSGAPDSDSPIDIEAVRIKPLIPPDFSLYRGTAAEVDETVRGFELALYPAYSVLDRLAAYDGYGPIPAAADPTAAYGVGSNERWSVDYANGIIRLTGAPLNSTTGVFNPLNVYGSINGHELTVGDGGRITLFATFYEYKGDTVGDLEQNVVTVGDGIISTGSSIPGTNDTLSGISQSTMAAAMSELSSGGTVFVKAGNYVYTGSVTVPANIKIVGMGGVTITRPSSVPAFMIESDDTTIEGITISGAASARGAIEIITTANTTLDGVRTVQNATIKNCTLWATAAGPAIQFTPGHASAVYRNVNINDNVFAATSANPEYITESTILSGTVDITNLTISGNDFGDGPATGLDIDGTAVDSVNEIHIINNHAGAAVDISIATAATVNDLIIIRNSNFGDITVSDSLTNAMIKDNSLATMTISGAVVQLSEISGNILSGTFVWSSSGTKDTVILSKNNITGASTITSAALTNCNISNNIFVGAYTNSITSTDCNISDNTFIGQATFGNYTTSSVTGNTFESASAMTIGTLTDSTINSNQFSGNLTVSTMIESVFSNNNVIGTITFSGNLTWSNINNNSTDDMSISGGSVQTSNINDNTITGFLAWSSASTKNRVNISGNVVDIATAITGAAAMSACYIKNNIFSTTYTNTGVAMDDCEFSHNHVGSAATLDSLTNSTVSDNNFNTILNIGGSGGVVQNSNIANNTIKTDFNWSSSVTKDKAIVSGNNITGETTISGASLTDCNISDNVITGTYTNTGVAFTNCNFINNVIGNTATFDSLTDCNVSDNTITSTFTISGAIVQDSIVRNNITDGAFAWSSGTTKDKFKLIGNIVALTTTISGAADMTDGEISNNTFVGAYTNTGLNFTDCNITNNNFVSTVFMKDISYCNLSNNNMQSTFTFEDAAGGVMSGNSIEGDISGATFNQQVVSGNIFDGVDFDMSGTVSETTFADNNSQTNLTVAGNMDFGTFNGNYFAGDVAFANVDQNTISNNKIYSFTASALTKATFGGNEIDSTVNVSGTTNAVLVTGNYISSTVTLAGDVDNTTLVGNKFWDVAFTHASGTFINNNICSNTFGSTLTFSKGVTECVISDNAFDTNISFGAVAFTSCVVADNVTVGSFTMSGALTDTMIDGNNVGSSMTISGADINNSSIVNNMIDTAFAWSSAITKDKVMLSGNHITTTTTISGADLTDCNISDNVFTGNYTNTGIAFTNCNFTNNMLNGTATLSSTTDCNISDNNFGSTLTVGDGTTISTITTNISDNVIVGAFAWSSDTAKTKTTISGNNITGTTTIDGAGDMQDCNIVNNVFTGAYTNTGVLLNDCNFVNNTVFSTAETGSIFDSVISNNKFGSTLTLSGISTRRSIINNNVIIGDLVMDASGTKDFIMISNNNITGAMTISDAIMTSCNVAGNIIVGNVTLVDFSASTFSGNTLSGSLTAGSFILRSSIDNNSITGAVTTDEWNEGTISSNAFASTLTISAADTSGMVDSMLSNNFIEGELDITATGSNQCLIRSSIVGNSTDGIDLNSVDGIAMQYSNISHNILNGNLTVNTTGIAGPFNQCVISGNISPVGVANMTFDATEDIASGFSQTVISNNMLPGSVITFGSGGTKAHHFFGLTITGNVFTGGIYFFSDRNPAFTNVSVIGNHVGIGRINLVGSTASDIIGGTNNILAIGNTGEASATMFGGFTQTDPAVTWFDLNA